MSKITKHLLILLVVILLNAGLFYQTAYSQSNKGSIIGTVKDPNKAVVPDAKVTVTNNSNGESHRGNKFGLGRICGNQSDPGNYQITIENSGLKRLFIVGDS